MCLISAIRTDIIWGCIFVVSGKKGVYLSRRMDANLPMETHWDELMEMKPESDLAIECEQH